MDKEIFKDIKDYEGLYQISNFGRVKSVSRKRIDRNQILEERILKQRKKENGYLIVNLSKLDIDKKMYVHRLVAQTFIPNPNNLQQVNHKDENKMNNKVDNLEWCTQRYNSNYNNLPLKRNKKINQYDLDGNFIKTWNSLKEINEYFNLPNNRGDISDCTHERQKSAFGYKWAMFKEQ